MHIKKDTVERLNRIILQLNKIATLKLPGHIEMEVHTAIRAVGRVKDRVESYQNGG